MADAVMPADRFWEIIDGTTTFAADRDAQVEALSRESSLHVGPVGRCLHNEWWRK